MSNGIGSCPCRRINEVTVMNTLYINERRGILTATDTPGSWVDPIPRPALVWEAPQEVLDWLNSIPDELDWDELNAWKEVHPCPR